MRRHSGSVSGNAGIVIVLLLLVAAAAAWWFLFRETPAPTLPPEGGDKSISDTKGVPTGNGGVNNSVERKTAPGAAAGESLSSEAASGLPMTEAGAVDWKARYEQLKTQYSRDFNEPQIGVNAKIRLASGQIVEGKINDITDKSITLRITQRGKATYQKSQISQISQLVLFKDVFADYTAKKTIAEERAAMKPVETGGGAPQ